VTDPTRIPTEPMYVLANLAVGGNWPGSPDASTPFPSDLEIDWIHVFDRKADTTAPSVALTSPAAFWSAAQAVPYIALAIGG